LANKDAMYISNMSISNLDQFNIVIIEKSDKRVSSQPVEFRK
jgi:hypothetical protein